MYFDSDSDVESAGIEVFDDSAIEAEGIHATIYKVEVDDFSHESNHITPEPKLWAVKSVSAFKNARLEPHDIRSEVHILARLSHPNIIELIEASYSHQQKIYQITMPFIPLTLNHLLENPGCSPYSQPEPQQAPNATQLTVGTASQFSALAKSFLYQIVSALAYLHTREPQPTAHRDLKPSNILVQLDGCIKLIDFGISWEGRPRGHGASFQEPRGLYNNERLTGFSDAPKPEWDETLAGMCCQVSSGPYRALELLFAPRQYDAFAVDLWSLGVLASGFFTSLAFKPKKLGKELREFDWDALIPENTATVPAPAYESPPEPDPTLPFNIPSKGTSTDGAWCRLPLFDCTRGEIGLIASVFKLLGTPTEASWPNFKSLPAASALIFKPVPPRPLRTLLPNLPAHAIQMNNSAARLRLLEDGENAVNLIEQLVRYPPESRTKAPDLLSHAYFTQGCSLLSVSACSRPEHRGHESIEVEDFHTLPELISQLLSTPGL